MSSNEKEMIVHEAQPVGERQLVTVSRVIEPFSIERYELMRPVATELSKSDLIPKAYIGKVADIMLAFEKLRSVGLNPVTSLSGTYVINSRVSIYGETWLAIIQSAPGYGGMPESWDGALDGGTAFTTFRRYIAGAWQTLTKSFSMEDAKKAKLAGKDTYGAYPKDMLQWRARVRAGVLFADVLQGMRPAEVAADYLEGEVVEQVPAEYVPQRKSEIAAPVAAPALPEQKPAGESFVLADVTVDASGKQGGKEWNVYKIATVEGGDFYSKEAETADLARSLKGKAVRLTFDVRKGDRRVISHVEPIEE